jgi:hypothetical protein
MASDPAEPGDRAEDARAVLALAPRPPVDIGRFTSEPLFGQPGIYPDGPPMAPAADPPMRDDAVVAELARLLAALDARVEVAIDDPRLTARAPDLAVRAALVLLGATVARAALDAFLAGDTATEHIAYSAPASPGRIIGHPDGAAPASGERVVNERYRAEHFALVAPSLAHDLLHDAVGAGQHEEAFLHAVLAMVHLQLLAAAPDLADLRTELARRQHSLAITLFNSRRPEDDRIRLIAPDGPGTIPGGAPALQSPDFWSIPFVGGPPVANPAPPALSEVLVALAAPEPVRDVPTTFDDALAHWFDEHHGRGWLSVRAQLRAGTALGLLDPDAGLRTWAGLADRS